MAFKLIVYKPPLSKNKNNYVYVKEKNFTEAKKRHFELIRAKYVGEFEVNETLVNLLPTLIKPSVDTYLYEGREQKILIDLLLGKCMYEDHVVYYLSSMKKFQEAWSKIHTLESCFAIEEVPWQEVDFKMADIKDYGKSAGGYYKLKGGTYYNYLGYYAASVSVGNNFYSNFINHYMVKFDSLTGKAWDKKARFFFFPKDDSKKKEEDSRFYRFLQYQKHLEMARGYCDWEPNIKE
jgi:hypothetical protein